MGLENHSCPFLLGHKGLFSGAVCCYFHKSVHPETLTKIVKKMRFSIDTNKDDGLEHAFPLSHSNMASFWISVPKIFRSVPIPPRWKLRHPRSKGPKGSCDWYILGSEDKKWWHGLTHMSHVFQKRLLFFWNSCHAHPPPTSLIEEKIKIKLPTRWGGIFVPCDTSKK